MSECGLTPLLASLSPNGRLLALLGSRDTWDARCHFCGGPSYPWLTDDETWAKVEPLLGQQQACFECFAAAWFVLGLNNGEPFVIVPPTAREEAER